MYVRLALRDYVRSAFRWENGDAIFAWRELAYFRLFGYLILSALGVGFFFRGGAILTGLVFCSLLARFGLRPLVWRFPVHFSGGRRSNSALLFFVF